MSFGSPHRHYRRIDSTNDEARRLAAGGAPHGTVVTAAEQTAGRGRQGRSWTAPPGKALLYSAILRPLDEHEALLPLTVPLAVCEAAEELSPGIGCAIKWPNDVWLQGRKLAGILIEARPQGRWAVVGIGLNLSIARHEFPPELRETAISLDAVAVDPARRALDAALERWLAADRQTILAAWRGRDALRGREVAWENGSGVADGIDDGGHLAVALAGGGSALLDAGDVHLRL
jgi:BirA family transcriptional regulator, biotin operon repressor / biotin---[acetyl-CoA-carboxylase] ligase